YVPYDHPERLARFAVHGNWQAEQALPRNGQYQFLRGNVRFAREMAVWTLRKENATTRFGGQDVVVADVSRNLVALLGVRGAAGRVFVQSDDERVVMVGYQLWKTLLGNLQPGERLTLNIGGREHTVIGVMPPDMALPATAEVWRPLPLDVMDKG